MATLTTITGGGAFTQQNIRNINSNFSALNTGSSGGSILHQATVTLDNDQIIHLPTAAISVIAAQGSDTIILPVYAFAATHIVTPYSDITEGAAIWLGHGSDGSATVTTLVGSDSSQDTITPFLTTDGSIMWGLPANVLLATRSYSTGSPSELLAGASNSPIKIAAYDDNADWGGGNAANTLLVSVAYLVLNASTGLFE